MSLFLKLILMTLLGVASGSTPYACWLPASVLHTHVVEPHYWESYNGGDYKNPQYIGFMRPVPTESRAFFIKLTKERYMPHWKVLAYPPGTVAWDSTAGTALVNWGLYTVMEGRRTGVCRTNNTEFEYRPARSLNEMPTFIYEEARANNFGFQVMCNGEKWFEALVTTDQRDDLETEIFGFGPHPDSESRPCTPEALGLPKLKKLNDADKLSKDDSDATTKVHGKNGNKPNLVCNHCWSAWTSKTQRHPGHPIGHLGARSFHLIRLIWPNTQKISFGTLILSEKKAVVFGPKNSNPIKPIIQVLTSHNTPIKWIKTNQTSFIHQTLKNWLVVGRHFENPYESSTKRKDISYGVCRPNLKMFQKKKDSLVGIANSDSGFCKVYFGGQAIYFTKFYIGVASRKTDKLECTDEIELCPGTVHQSVHDPTWSGLKYFNGQKMSDKGNSNFNNENYNRPKNQNYKNDEYGAGKNMKRTSGHSGLTSASLSESGEYNSTSQASVESNESLEFLYDDDN